MQNTDTTNLMTRSEVAEYLGTTVNWLDHLGDAGPSFVKMSRRKVRYFKTDIDAWLTERKVR